MNSFSIEQSLQILKQTPNTLYHLLSGLTEVWTHKNEGEETWSPFDVVGHLIHGEKTDWMVRLDIILEQGDTIRFIPFDRFAQFESSKNKTLLELLGEFKQLREKNIKRLQELNINNEQLKLQGIHPEFGRVTLKELLSTWVVHDLGHIAQITRVMASQYKEHVGPWQEYLPILTK